jgi:hypothetical protein
MDSSSRNRQQAVHLFRLRYLLLVPVLLAIATGFTLFVHSDTNIAMLYSQCHARARIPWLSHIPVLGAPSCFLVSFFHEALASVRTFGIMAAVLSFVAGLLTVSTVEAARVCNGPSVLIAYPTGAWLVFNLLGGALVWELVIIPAFFHRARQILATRRMGAPAASSDSANRAVDPDFGEAMRHLRVFSEAVAIPVAVAVGYIVPSVLMLTLNNPVAIVVWLFFPLWVSLVRQAVRAVAIRIRKEDNSFHLESNRLALLGMYTVPVLCSILSHGLLLWSVLRPDDRKELTRATSKFIEIDIFFIGLTVLYWLFVEAGWMVTMVVIVSSIVLGPGAGLCIGWIYREGFVDLDRSVTAVAVGSRQGDGGHASEETPLLQS